MLENPKKSFSRLPGLFLKTSFLLSEGPSVTPSGSQLLAAVAPEIDAIPVEMEDRSREVRGDAQL